MARRSRYVSTRPQRRRGGLLTCLDRIVRRLSFGARDLERTIDRNDPIRLGDLSWTGASAWFQRDPRLIVPVASLMQHGPHLPLATDAIITTAIAEGLSARHRVLVAPSLTYGHGSDQDRAYAGAGVIAQKTLHRVLNELVAGWEGQGVREILLITSNGFGPNYRALVSVAAGDMRLRAIDTNVVDLTPALGATPPPGRAGEIETSLILHLAPDLVRLDLAPEGDESPSPESLQVDGTEPVPLLGTHGVIGRPTAGTAEKGRRIYEYLVDYMGDRLFGDDGAERV